MLLIDGAGALANREEVIAAVDDALDEDPLPTRETWGTSARAARGQRAMMDAFGSPDPAEVERVLRERRERDDHR